MNQKIFKLLAMLLFVTVIASAQVKKQLVKINSVGDKEIVEFKYNSKGQLIFFVEIGTTSIREFVLKYDKNNILAECNLNRNEGEDIVDTKYDYTNTAYVLAQIKTGGKGQKKEEEENKIYINEKGQLTKTYTEFGELWEEFDYTNTNLSKYTIYLIGGKEQLVVNYEYKEDKSPFSGIKLPIWFWTNQIDNFKWCKDFTGEYAASRILVESTLEDDTLIVVTYEYDNDGFPIRQLYNDKPVKEFVYKTVK